MRRLQPTLVRFAICVLSAVIAPTALGLDAYERGEQFGTGLGKLIACVILLGALFGKFRKSDY